MKKYKNGIKCKNNKKSRKVKNIYKSCNEHNSVIFAAMRPTFCMVVHIDKHLNHTI